MHATGQNDIVLLTVSRLKDGFRLCSHSVLHSLEVNPTPRNFKIRDTRRRRAKCKKLGGHSAHRVLKAFDVAPHQPGLQSRYKIDESNAGVHLPGK